MRSIQQLRFWQMALAGMVWYSSTTDRLCADEPARTGRTPVKHAIGSREVETTAQKRSSGVVLADGWVYTTVPNGAASEVYVCPPGGNRLGSYGSETYGPDSYGGASRYRGNYPTGVRGYGDYSFSNYGAGGYGLGGYGLARYGLGTYGQSTLGWGNFGSYWTFSGYAGYAESSSYNY